MLGFARRLPKFTPTAAQAAAAVAAVLWGLSKLQQLADAQAAHVALLEQRVTDLDAEIALKVDQLTQLAEEAAGLFTEPDETTDAEPQPKPLAPPANPTVPAGGDRWPRAAGA